MMGMAVMGLTQVGRVLGCSAGACTLFCTGAGKHAQLACSGNSQHELGFQCCSVVQQLHNIEQPAQRCVLCTT
jgi:hypothetical protein